MNKERNRFLNKKRVGIKILIISCVFPPEPVVSAKLSYDIADALSENNLVTVISPRPSRPFGNKFNKNKLDFNFEHIIARSYIYPLSNIFGRFKESLSFGKYCYKYIAEHNQDIDIIYANTWPLLGQYFAVKASKKFGIPIIIHVQDIYPESLSKKLTIGANLLTWTLIPIDKYILKHATRIIFISQKMKEYLVKTRKIEHNKVEVISNWQDEKSFLNYNTNPQNKIEKPFTFMYLGNIGPVAGVDILIDAFVKLPTKNCRLIIAGSGSMKESLMQHAKKYPQYKYNITFWPAPEGKAPEILNKADVLLLPIKKGYASTSIPSKLPAYMFSSKPIIACADEDSDTALAVYEANCGWVIEPENSNLLTILMTKVITYDKKSLAIFGSNGKQYALTHFSKKNNLPKIIKIIRDTAVLF